MYRIGIDLGGTNIKAGVVNDQYEIVASAWCKTRLPRPSSGNPDGYGPYGAGGCRKGRADHG